jgi:hypothetical protein
MILHQKRFQVWLQIATSNKKLSLFELNVII